MILQSNYTIHRLTQCDANASDLVCAVNCAQSCHNVEKASGLLWCLILHINVTLVASFYLFGRFIS